MYGKTYIIGDTHGRAIKLQSEPEDLLIHLGDYEQGSIDTAAKKILILGNHDMMSVDLFDFACDGLLFNKIWFTHEPAERLPKGAVWNIYGHIHDGKINDFGYEQKSWHIWLPPNEVHELGKFMWEAEQAKEARLRREMIWTVCVF